MRSSKSLLRVTAVIGVMALLWQSARPATFANHAVPFDDTVTTPADNYTVSYTNNNP